MGLAGGLVKRVFSKSRSSAGGHDGNRKNFGGEKSKWSSVRLYICGDEFNSHPEDDLASSEGSEATVMQPVAEGPGEESSLVGKAEELEELVIKDSSTESFVRLNAAIHIQSAFRGFLARQQYEWIRQLAKEDRTEGLENASRMLEAISTEVQIGDSTENLRAEEQSIIVHHRLLNKSRSQVYRVKEEWDDSTVDSNIKKLRLQNKLEATTRRERALAYAFSQQVSKRASREAPKGKGNKQVQQKVMDETESKVLAVHHQTADIADVNNC